MRWPHGDSPSLLVCPRARGLALYLTHTGLTSFVTVTYRILDLRGVFVSNVVTTLTFQSVEVLTLGRQ